MMKDLAIHGWDMALMAETYLSILSEKVSKHGLERYYVPFLYIYENSGHVGQSEIARVMKRDKVTISRIVDYLHERGLVNRIADPKDRRVHLLEVTPKAHALVPKVLQGVVDTNDELFSEFNENERKVFKTAMGKLMNKIDALPESDYVVKAFKRYKKK